MAKLNYIVLCEELVEDEFGRLSLAKLFDTVNSKTLPTKALRFLIVFSIKFEDNDVHDGTVDLSIKVQDSNGKRVVRANVRAEVEASLGITSQLDLSNELPLTVEGIYKVTLGVNGHKVGGTEFMVKLVDKVGEQ